MSGSGHKPIRVMHVVTRMVRGGAQENTLANVAGLHGGVWESCLVTGPADGPEGSLEPECEAAGARLVRVPELVRELSPRQDITALNRLTQVMREERPHLVHTHTSKAGVLGRLAARRAKVPAVVHTPHGHVFHSYGGKLKTHAFILAERHCAVRAHRLVALTANERREHLELRIGHPDQWEIVHSGVDFAPFEAARGLRLPARLELGIPAEARVIGTVGRLVEVKGQTHLLDALASLGARHPGLHLLIVGDGPLREPLLDQARRLGFAVRTWFEGHLKAEGSAPAGGAPTVHFAGLRRDVPRLMAAMDIFALPSLNEGMGRVLVEAMAMELPCVASRVSGTPDVVDEGRTGLLVPPADPAALAGALGELLDDPSRAEAMGRAGRQRAVPAFGVKAMLERLEAIYRDVLTQAGVPLPPALEMQPDGEAPASSRIGLRASAAHARLRQGN